MPKLSAKFAPGGVCGPGRLSARVKKNHVIFALATPGLQYNWPLDSPFKAPAVAGPTILLLGSSFREEHALVQVNDAGALVTLD